MTGTESDMTTERNTRCGFTFPMMYLGKFVISEQGLQILNYTIGKCYPWSCGMMILLLGYTHGKCLGIKGEV